MIKSKSDKESRRQDSHRRIMGRMLSVAFVAGAAMAGIAVSSMVLSDPEGVAAADDASRSTEATASRGADRTPDSVEQPATSQPAAVEVATTQPTPTTVEETTTTTAAPTTTTTAAPKPSTTTTTKPPTPPTTKAPAAQGGNSQSGKASYYSYKAGGCAHKTLPKGTVVTVTNVSNGKTTTCVVNDRGPYVAGRIIDLDTSVFRQVASTSAGVFEARISW